MLISNKVVVVTGGANGIGRAMCERFARDGARGIVVADREEEAANVVAGEVGGIAVTADVGDEAEIAQVVRRALEFYGRIDLFCSNAGISIGGPLETTPEQWDRMWRVNVLAHVHAARAVVPLMLAQGGGYLLQTASAAGLLTQIGSAPYAVTKHAAVAFAEWLAITYGDRGLRVSCLCPQGVRTRMLAGAGSVSQALLDAGAVDPDDVAARNHAAESDRR